MAKISLPTQKVSPKANAGGSHGNRVNQVFLATCIGSLCLQVLASMASWHNTNVMRESFLQDSANMEHSLMSYRRRTNAVSAVDSLPDSSPSTPSGPIDPLATPKPSGRLRVLFGILAADFPNDLTYRHRHRQLFELWNDPRVCSLPEFRARPLDTRYECELIYTFVLGGNPDAPSTELVDDSRPMEVQKPVTYSNTTDLNWPDMTLLNIRENMNEGKSQTWLKYGAEIAQEYGLDYVTKCDADSLLHLHEFFQWAYVHLPPAPYNKNVYVGALRDKAYWPKHETNEERVRFESYFGNNFEGVHLYTAGQLYMMSTDLAKFVGQEALANSCSYCEGHEDHDISAMAFHSRDPIKLMVISRPQRFWEHPVKGEPRWRRIWARESARMEGVAFEGNVFNKDSSFETVMARRRK